RCAEAWPTACAWARRSIGCLRSIATVRCRCIRASGATPSACTARWSRPCSALLPPGKPSPPNPASSPAARASPDGRSTARRRDARRALPGRRLALKGASNGPILLGDRGQYRRSPRSLGSIRHRAAECRSSSVRRVAHDMHWLAQIAQRAGLPRAESLDIAADMSTPMAWAGVEQHCGLGEDELVRAVAAATGLVVANLADAHPPARRLVPDRIARRWDVIPLRETDKHIVVATSDPSNVEAEQAIAFASGRRVMFEIASPAMLHAALAVPGQPIAPSTSTPINGTKPVSATGAVLDAAGVAQVGIG